MPLYKRGKIWWFNLWHEGKHVQKSTNQGNKNVARHMEAAYHTALVMGEVGITERKKIPSFKLAMSEYIKWSKKEHLASTHRRYAVSEVALSRYFGRFDSLDKITPDEVEKFKGARQNQFATARSKQHRRITKRKVKPATVNRELACLRAMFNHAIKAGLGRYLVNPVSQVKPLREENEQTRVLNYDEEKRYLAAATLLLRDVATIMLQTGMRPEEVYRIQPVNVHLKGGYLSNPFGKTKAAKRRDVNSSSQGGTEETARHFKWRLHLPARH